MEGVLKGQLSVPEESHSGFVYFLRTPWHVFTVENFHATVVFGSINRDTMMCVLKAMENIYVPVALNTGEWPESILFLFAFIAIITWFEDNINSSSYN